MRTGRSGACLAILLAVLGTGAAQAQPRPCLDIDGNGVVELADVELAQASLASRETAIDARADFDLRGGVDVVDLINQLRVAQGEQQAILSFEPSSASAGDRVEAVVQNVSDENASGLRVVVGTSSASFQAEGVSLRGGELSFVMPDVGDPGELTLPDIESALPGACLDNIVLVHLEGADFQSNACPILFLRPGEQDSDGDGLPDSKDTCPFHFDPQNGDTDIDGIGDLCDNCPATPNVDQIDSNGDGSGDACAPPEFAVINGILVEPPPGVDEELQNVEKAHAVLVLTREIDAQILQDLADIGIEIDRPLARHAFVVAANAPGFADLLPGFIWFRSLFPLDGEIRSVGDVRGLQPKPNDVLLLDVEIHSDVELADADAMLVGLGATVLAPGIELLNNNPSEVEEAKFHILRRINHWRILLPGTALTALTSRDEVLSVQFGHQNTTQSSKNFNSRAAVNVNPLIASGLNGSGITLGEWDAGWAAGDNAFPPALPGGGVNAALSPRVMVRDHNLGNEGIAYPAGCTAANVSCNAGGGVCIYGNHATHVGGTMVGDGTLAGGGPGPNAGMAAQANHKSYEWSDNNPEVVCERQDAINNFSTVAHNNSWSYCPSCALMGFYEGRSVTYDQDIRASPAATELFAAANYQFYRNNLFNPCSGGFDPPCALPPIFTSPTCTATPPGVTPPPAIPVPPASTLNRFYTVSPPGGTAKNTLTVGNIDFLNNRLNNSSSLGPTRDGRLKPEVVAHGTSVTSTCVPGLSQPGLVCGASNYLTISGTSMATPAVTGVTGLLNERAGQLGIPLQNASARALLAHTADDLGVHAGAGGAFNTVGGLASSPWQAFGADDGPDYLTGYGLVDADAARNHMDNGNIGGLLKPSGCPTGVTYASIPFESPVAVAGPGPVPGCPPMIWDVVWYITVPPGKTELKVTIAWNDVQATAGANPTLVNDIDLMVSEPGGSLFHYPWWLDPSCPYRQAVRVQSPSFNNAVFGDHVNNLEQVHVVGGLTAGQWRIIVRTDGLGSGPQPFSMMVSMN